MWGNRRDKIRRQYASWTLGSHNDTQSYLQAANDLDVSEPFYKTENCAGILERSMGLGTEQEGVVVPARRAT